MGTRISDATTHRGHQAPRRARLRLGYGAALFGQSMGAPHQGAVFVASHSATHLGGAVAVKRSGGLCVVDDFGRQAGTTDHAREGERSHDTATDLSR